MGYDTDPDGSCLRLAETIRQFIGVPTQDDLMARVRAVVSHGNIIEVVHLLRQERQLSLTEAKQLVDAIRGAAGESKP
jgi:ribosomal protein L7/L12